MALPRRPFARLPAWVVAATFCLAGLPPVLAAGGGGGDSPSASAADLQPALDAIKAERWAEAIKLLQTRTSRVSTDADAFNWLGYAYRKSGQLDAAFNAYRRALAIDPRHLGVHEYIGEAYLMAGQPAKAEEHLRRLRGLCGSPCEQADDLAKAIADYRAKPGTAATAAR